MAFDIDKYTANSTAVGWDDLDFDEFDRNPLPGFYRTGRCFFGIRKLGKKLEI